MPVWGKSNPDNALINQLCTLLPVNPATAGSWLLCFVSAVAMFLVGFASLSCSRLLVCLSQHLACPCLQMLARRPTTARCAHGLHCARPLPICAPCWPNWVLLSGALTGKPCLTCWRRTGSCGTGTGHCARTSRRQSCNSWWVLLGGTGLLSSGRYMEGVKAGCERWPGQYWVLHRLTSHGP